MMSCKISTASAHGVALMAALIPAASACPEKPHANDYDTNCDITGCDAGFELITRGDGRKWCVEAAAPACPEKPHANDYDTNCDITGCEGTFFVSNNRQECCRPVPHANDYGSGCIATGCDAGFEIIARGARNYCKEAAAPACPEKQHASGYDTNCDITGCDAGFELITRGDGRTWCVEAAAPGCPERPHANGYDATCRITGCVSGFELLPQRDVCVPTPTAPPACPEKPHVLDFTADCSVLTCEPGFDVNEWMNRCVAATHYSLSTSAEPPVEFQFAFTFDEAVESFKSFLVDVLELPSEDVVVILEIVYEDESRLRTASRTASATIRLVGDDATVASTRATIVRKIESGELPQHGISGMREVDSSVSTEESASGSGSASTPIIVGVVLGVLALGAVLAATCFFVVKKKAKSSVTDANAPQKMEEGQMQHNTFEAQAENSDMVFAPAAEVKDNSDLDSDLF